MFETATLSYGPSSKRVWATAMGFTGQALLIGCALLAPLISPQTLGRAFLVTTLVTPGAPPPPPPPGPKVVPQSHHAVATQIFRNILTMPVSVPAIAAIIVDDPPEAAGSGPGVPGGVPGGVARWSARRPLDSIIERRRAGGAGGASARSGQSGAGEASATAGQTSAHHACFAWPRRFTRSNRFTRRWPGRRACQARWNCSACSAPTGGFTNSRYCAGIPC